VAVIVPILPLSLPSINTTLSPLTRVNHRPPTDSSNSFRLLYSSMGPLVRWVLTVPNVSFRSPTSRLGANRPNSQSSLLSALLRLISLVTSLRTKVFCSRLLFRHSRSFVSFRFASRRAACFSANMVRRITFCIFEERWRGQWARVEECRLSCTFLNKSSIFGLGALVDRPRSSSRDHRFSGVSMLHSQICCFYEDYYDLTMVAELKVAGGIGLNWCGHTEE
jgi:hypothetical protein